MARRPAWISSRRATRCAPASIRARIRRRSCRSFRRRTRAARATAARATPAPRATARSTRTAGPPCEGTEPSPRTTVASDSDGSCAGAGNVLYLARDFFLTGEVKRRLFLAGTEGDAHGLVVAGEKQTSLLVGMGFYLF